MLETCVPVTTSPNVVALSPRELELLAVAMSVVVENGSKRRESESATSETEEVDAHFEPVVELPEVEVSTNEENEDELIKLRAKLFRFDTADPQHPEWKERGTGEVKLLRHKENNSVRVVMRRDKTLKICANHFITPWMELKPSCGSNRAWVWTVPADFADEMAKSECLAIRFASHDIATQWKEKFEEAKKIIREECELYKNTSSTTLEDSSDETDPEADEDPEINDENKENQTENNEQEPKTAKQQKDDASGDGVISSKMAELNVTN